MNVPKLVSRSILVVIAVAALVPVAAQGAGGHGVKHHQRFYQQTNLVSDIPGLADLTDPNLVNAWGISAGPTTPFWISDNGAGVATLYNVSNPDSPAIVPLVVTIPPPGGSPPDATAAPTGNIFNPTQDFKLDATNPARFIFATEDGTISGWNPNVDATNAVLKADNSASGASYKGLAMGRNGNGNFLFATNFHAGTIDVFDATFAPVTPSGSFTDPSLPPCNTAAACFAPFGIRNIDGLLYVTYALQDADKHDDVKGPGNGFVDVYNTNGNFIRRLISQGSLNSPWGLAVAPNHFGEFSHDLLVGNFGDGRINAYNIRTGALRGALEDENGGAITIDGLWGLTFGNGAAAGPTNTLFFTAGPNDEADGLFGMLEAEKANKK